MRFSRTSTIAFAILLLIFGTLLVHHGITAGSPSTGTNHALLIGIGGYKNWDKLRSPVLDAESIARTLIEKYNFKKSNVTLLTDKSPEKPTLVNILTYLDRYSGSLGPDDNLLIFFSGHSAEDIKGETYWIPIDGGKGRKLTWLSHTAITEDVFNSETFKVKNLCIITDSHFSTKLTRREPVTISPIDLRYEEKIAEMATRRSREVISFGEEHRPGTADTNGLGLFTFFINKALDENTLDIIDFENLVFEDENLNPIIRLAGTRPERGRLRTELDAGGQFVVRRLGEAPLIDVHTVEVNPPKGYPGDEVIIQAETSAPADEVIVDISGKTNRMSGRDTRWTYRFRPDKVGKKSFQVAALNPNGLPGKIRQGLIDIIRPKAKVSNVLEAKVAPASGTSGDRFTFTAVTDTPAREVTLVIGDKRFPMSGSGTQWTLSRTVDIEGTVPFSIAATNDDGVRGNPRRSTLRITPGIVNVVSISASPKTGYAGEEYTIIVRTDRAATNVRLEMDGRTFDMVGRGKNWELKRQISEIGKKQFRAFAVNSQGKKGAAKGGELLAKKTPLPIPDVARVEVNVAPPGKGYAGDSFIIVARTNKPAAGVSVNIDGSRFNMKGAGTKWTFGAVIDKVGVNKYRVVARNKDGKSGQSREGEIITRKRPAAPVGIRQASISPQRGYIGLEFTFTAVTDRPARGMSVLIAQTRGGKLLSEKLYEMEGSGTEWKLTRPIWTIGTLQISMVALNEDGQEGIAYTSKLPVYQNQYVLNQKGVLVDVMTGNQVERFRDNKDGTITDLATSLMWTKTPKQIATNWDGAADYLRKLSLGGHTGWRLPTLDEMKRLMDESQVNPALPADHPFSNILTHMGYWTKTRHRRFGRNYVYQMNLWRGTDSHLKKTENGIVWPVRYAGLAEKNR